MVNINPFIRKPINTFHGRRRSVVLKAEGPWNKKITGLVGITKLRKKRLISRGHRVYSEILSGEHLLKSAKNEKALLHYVRLKIEEGGNEEINDAIHHIFCAFGKRLLREAGSEAKNLQKVMKEAIQISGSMGKNKSQEDQRKYIENFIMEVSTNTKKYLSDANQQAMFELVRINELYVLYKLNHFLIEDKDSSEEILEESYNFIKSGLIGTINTKHGLLYESIYLLLIMPKNLFNTNKAVFREHFQKIKFGSALLTSLFQLAKENFLVLTSPVIMPPFYKVKARQYNMMIANTIDFAYPIFKSILINKGMVPKDAFVAPSLFHEYEEDIDPFSKLEGLRDIRYVLSHGFPIPTAAKTEDKKLIKEGKDIVAVAILSGLNEDMLAVLREGSKRVDANFILVPQEEFVKFSGRKKNLRAEILKGLMMSDGRLVFHNFDPPLQVHYLANFFDSLWKRLRGSKIPRPSRKNIYDATKDKGFTQFIMKDLFPPTWDFAFGFTIGRNIDYSLKEREIKHGLKVRLYKRDPHIKSRVMRALDIFIEKHNLNSSEMVVVKPADKAGGEGVKFFSLEDKESIVEYILELLESSKGVLIQKKVIPPRIMLDGKGLADWNLRVFVSKGKDNKAIVSDILVRADTIDGPVNLSISATALTFDELCAKLNLDEKKKKEFRTKIEEISVEAFTIIEKDDRLRKTQADFMGVDVMVDGDLKPYIIEVNDYKAGGMWDLDNIVPEEEIGKSSREWVDTMIRRGRKYKE